MEPSTILEVEFQHGSGSGSWVPVARMEMLLGEFRAQPALAMATLRGYAAQCLEGSGEALGRFVYEDDDGDWCSLLDSTVEDALGLTAIVGDGRRRLTLRLFTEAAAEVEEPMPESKCEASGCAEDAGDACTKDGAPPPTTTTSGALGALEVQLLIPDGGEQGAWCIADVFRADAAEALQWQGAFMEVVDSRARQICPFYEALKYKDDEDDWCSLTVGSISDALDFATMCSEGVRSLSIRIAVAEPQASCSGSATPPTPSPASPAPAPPSPPPCDVAMSEGFLQQAALHELNRLAATADMRRLVPKLAGAALSVVQDVQWLGEALFPLIDLLLAFQSGELEADAVPAVLPVAVSALMEVGAAELPGLLKRLKVAGEGALEELRREDAGMGQKEVEVHPNIVCDGCDMDPLIGARYKSLTQDNYDLCQACYEKEPRDASQWARVRSEVFGSVAGSFYKFNGEETPPAAAQEEGCICVSGSAAKAVKAAEAAAEDDADLTGMDADAMRAALSGLLRHPDPAVRAAAAAAIGTKPKDDKEQEEEEEQHQQQQEQEQQEEKESAPSSSPESDWEEVELPAPVRASAKVLCAAPLLLGVEASEDDAARGDATAEPEFEAALAGSGATQAFRLGRVTVAAGEAAAVPVCAKVVVVNDGSVEWPETTAVTCVAGDSMGFPQLPLGALPPGAPAEVVMDLQLPPRGEAGATRACWAIIDVATGQALGPLLIFEAVWA